MLDFLKDFTYFGVPLTLICYGIGLVAKDRLKLAIFNPMIISLVILIPVLKLANITYTDYAESTQLITYLLTPATICLAVPLYEKINALKDNIKAIAMGILSGVLTCMVSVYTICKLFSLDQKDFATLVPKSITTAIGMAISEELGGAVTITVIVIMVTGITGAIIPDLIFKLCKITDPIAKGLALGTASHVIGTSKALEYGTLEGAVSSLSIAVTGLLTVIVAPICLGIY